MRYCGSKAKFMRYLTPILTENMDENTRFIDLFSGGANVICQIPFKNKIAVDNNKYVIALWKELQRHGMKRIPNKLTEEEYNDIKKSYLNGEKRYPKYLIGYVGTCCSFGGSWFNGYARYNPNKDEDHIQEAYNGLETQVRNFKYLNETTFICASYDKFPVEKTDIVYCDPPYASTKSYESDFDNNKFWDWVRENDSKAKRLYVSEYDPPNDFKCIWQKEKKDSLGTQKGKKQQIRIEKLFVFDGR